jgi:hypothetical protein
MVPGERDRRRFMADAQPQVRDLETLPKYFAKGDRRVAVITGDPGSGKTTLLRRFLDNCIQGARKDREAVVPVWLDLRDWPSDLSLEAWLRRALADADMRVPDASVDVLLDQQDLFLFLDGLDQISSAASQAKAYRSILDFTGTYGLCGVMITCQTETYEQLKANESTLPRVQILPLSYSEVLSVLSRLGNSASGLSEATGRDPDLLGQLQTPLYLRAAARAFRDRSGDEILAARQSGSWESNIVEQYIDMLVAERGNDNFIALAVLRRFLSWMVYVLDRGSVSSFYGFVRPGMLRDPDLRKARLGRVWSILAALLSAGPFAVAAYLIIGPRSAVTTFGLAACAAGILGGKAINKLDLEMSVEKRRWAWSAVRVALPGLAGRALGSAAVLVIVQYLSAEEVARARRLGGMTGEQANQAGTISVMFLALLVARYLYGFLHRRGTEVVFRPLEVDLDVWKPARPAARARLVELLDFEVPLQSGVLALVCAGIWSAAYSLFSTLKSAHLRSTWAQSAFHALLSWMQFPRRSPLALDPGIEWSISVGAIFFVATWLGWIVFNVWSSAALTVWIEAAGQDSGLGNTDMIYALEYGRHLTLLRRIGGAYSFVHSRYEDFYRDHVPSAGEGRPRQARAGSNSRRQPDG